MYGFRYGEKKLAALGALKPFTRFIARTDLFRELEVEHRPVVQCSLGCPVVRVALPQPCPFDPNTLEAGVRKRAAAVLPAFDPTFLQELNDYTKNYVERKLTPLAPDSDLGLLTWLKQTKYSEARKQELVRKFDEFTTLFDPEKKYLKVGSFPKDETYVDMKHIRIINARSDEFKNWFGPIAKLMETEVYKLSPFIKHVPVLERARHICQRLYSENAEYYATDYTTFEAMFLAEIMRSVEFVLYSHLTRNLAIHDELIKVCEEVLAGRNVCLFRLFIVHLMATRMSGEMVTSLGNGFSNLMFVKFLCWKLGIKGLKCFVEGDDMIATTSGGFPTAEDFAKLGANIKIDMTHNLSEASFCGIVFDEVDLINVTDPLEVLAKFGWTSGRYSRCAGRRLKCLLRSKAMCYSVQYRGAPVIDALAQYALKVTAGADVEYVVRSKNTTWWDRIKIEKAKLLYVRERTSTPMRTRELVERKYGLEVAKQLAVEAYLDSLTTLQPLDLPLILDSVPQSWVDYFESYNFDLHPHHPDLNYPPFHWPVMADHQREW